MGFTKRWLWSPIRRPAGFQVLLFSGAAEMVATMMFRTSTWPAPTELPPIEVVARPVTAAHVRAHLNAVKARRPDVVLLEEVVGYWRESSK